MDAWKGCKHLLTVYNRLQYRVGSRTRSLELPSKPLEIVTLGIVVFLALQKLALRGETSLLSSLCTKYQTVWVEYPKWLDIAHGRSERKILRSRPCDGRNIKKVLRVMVVCAILHGCHTVGVVGLWMLGGNANTFLWCIIGCISSSESHSKFGSTH